MTKRMSYLKLFVLFAAMLALPFGGAMPDDEPVDKRTAGISGYVKDAATGETLLGATVYVSQTRTGTTTNGYGFTACGSSRDIHHPMVLHRLRRSYGGC